MVKEYLEKTRDGFVSRRITLMADANELENKFKENLQMIQLLEDASDPNYESFTPREINSYNRQKVKELEAEQKVIEVKLSNKRAVISEMDAKIDEITSVIKVAREDISASNPEMIEEIVELDSGYNILLLESIEGERQRIARDLHDTTVQSLTSLVHKSELCMKLIDVDPIRCKLELSTVGKILRDVINDARKMIYDLRPMSFDDIGFDITIERNLDKFKQANNIHCSFEVVGEPYQIQSVVALTLLRVVQESCSNSVKHGHASLVKVVLTYDEDSVTITIQDDGEGFDVSSIPKTTRSDNSGFGLSMMKERIYLLSGKLIIESSKGKGCLTTVKVPVKKEDK